MEPVAEVVSAPEQKEKEQAPVVPSVSVEPMSEVTELGESAKEEKPVAPSSAEEEVFAVKRPEFVSKINVVGKVDLSAINQSTRPKKKSKEEKKMILVNTDYISGKELEMLGLVKGSTIHSKHLGKDIAQAFKMMVGGELKSYNEMMNEARAIATKRMVAEAEELGADAIVNIRYASSAIMQGAAEVIAYGTAVKIVNK